MTFPARSPALPLAILLIAAGAAAGQEAPPPLPPLPEDLPAEHTPDEALPESVPGLEQTDHRIRPPELLREGSFIVRRRGSMVKLPGSEWAFVYHRDAAGEAERPMVLIPSQTLQRMEQTVEGGPERVIFSITGEVFAYRGVNYLLPTAAAVEHASMLSAPAETDPASTPPAAVAPTPEPATPASPEVQALIKQLEAQRERPRTLDPAMQRPATLPAPSARSSEAETAAPSDVIPEGRTLIKRTGRLVRSSTGDWMLVFDVGTQTDPKLDRPLLLVPSMNLQQMESLAARGGDTQNIEVSGRVLLYQGRNYLIPTLYQARPVAELSPRQ